MYPTVRSGDAIVVSQRPNRGYRVGDIVVYNGRKTHKVLIAHRLVGVVSTKKGLFYLLKGDATWRCDPLISQEDILGSISQIKKQNIAINLRGPAGTVLNICMVWLSMSRIIALSLWLMRSAKYLWRACKNRLRYLGLKDKVSVYQKERR